MGGGLAWIFWKEELITYTKTKFLSVTLHFYAISESDT